MVKTKGSIDKFKRKRRKDRGKHRKKYAGKLVKKKRKIMGKYVYISKRNEDSPIKLYFWTIDKMSLEGLKHFHRKSRKYIRREVWGKNRVRIDVHPSEINNREKLEAFAEEHLWEATWLMLLWTHRKNRFHCSPRGVAIIKIKDTSEGIRARLYPSFKNRGLKRYSFFKS